MRTRPVWLDLARSMPHTLETGALIRLGPAFCGFKYRGGIGFEWPRERGKPRKSSIQSDNRNGGRYAAALSRAGRPLFGLGIHRGCISELWAIVRARGFFPRSGDSFLTDS